VILYQGGRIGNRVHQD